MNRILYEEIERHLNALLQEGPADCREGICPNVTRRVGHMTRESIISWMKSQWVNWEHFSGNIAFPVCDKEGINGGTPHDGSSYQYFNILNLWSGRQGELRRELCEFLIRRLEEGSGILVDSGN